MTASTYNGLTHHCDDPDCHVPGFVRTLADHMTAPVSRAGDEAAEARMADLIGRLRGIRSNYAHRADHLPHPPLSWVDAVADLDDVLAALDGLTWDERRGLTPATAYPDPCPWHPKGEEGGGGS